MKAHMLTLVAVLCFMFGPQFANGVDDHMREQETAVHSAPESGAGAVEAERKDPKKEEKRRAILAMKGKTLGQLYKTNPEAKAEIESAVGYEVFDATGINIIMFVGVKGKGVAVENSTGKVTYMNMVRAGTGPGVRMGIVLPVADTEALLQHHNVSLGNKWSARMRPMKVPRSNRDLMTTYRRGRLLSSVVQGLDSYDARWMVPTSDAASTMIDKLCLFCNSGS